MTPAPDTPRKRRTSVHDLRAAAEGKPSTMSDPVLDRKLREFLDEHAEDKANGNTIANLRLEVHQIRNDMNELAAEQRVHRLRLDRHGKDIKALKEAVFNRTEEIDTGVHQVEDLRRHLAEKEAELKERRDSVWWQRQKVTWAVGILAFVGTSTLLGLGGVIWYLLTHAR